MGWIRAWFGRGKQKAARQTQRAAVSTPARSESAFRPEADAEGPANLAGGLETGVDDSDALDELIADLRERALATDDRVERAALDGLKRTLQAEGLKLPPMPGAVIRVQRLIDSPNCTVTDLGREIALDPALTTKVVGIANSPFYGGLEPVNAVRDALVRIGLRETRNIVLAITLRGKVFRVPGFEAEVQRLWKHSLATSIAAQEIAAEVGVDPDPAFIAGLVHDVGRIVILSLVVEGQRAAGGDRLTNEALEELVGSLHARVGAHVADSWRLSDELSAAIAFHHDPAAAPDAAKLLTSALAAADVCAKRIESVGEVGADPALDAEWSDALARIGVGEERGAEIEAETREAFEQLAKSL